MSADRRNFLKTIGSAALVSAAAGPLVEFVGQESKRPRVVVFWEEGFPTIDGLNLERGALAAALGAFDTQFWGEKDILAERLTKEPPDLFVNPYGAAFPLHCWYPLHQYLWPGHNWLNLGGVPLAVPCVRSGAGWRAETRQPQYHKRFGIYQTFPVAGNRISQWRRAGAEHAHSFKDFAAEEVYEMYLRFTTTNDYSNETGTAGQRDANLKTLVTGSDAKGQRIAAPVVQIDRMLGDYAGGRWVWANYKGRINQELLTELAEIALQGASELVARPTLACYRVGEMPTINVQVSRPKGGPEQVVQEACQIELQKYNDGPETPLAESFQKILEIKLNGGGSLMSGETPLNIGQPLTPGLYQIRARVTMTAPNPRANHWLSHRTGFWIYDSKLMAAGTPITTDKHYFYRNGEPFPVTGTTYMASDAHRKFLLEPNPFVWDKDFAEMKAAGVNMVRTGLWTAWKNFMLDVGTVNEAALRALDAFMLTARKYDIPIIWTFFAFLPEMWGGKNAYLDPRAVQAQKQFLSIIAQRYGIMNDVIWDLINEPSFCNPDRLWSCRPNYDAFERQAWGDWLKSRYPAETDEEREVKLLENWRATPEDGTGLPKLEEFDGVAIHDNRRPFKTIDYKLFAQETFTRWVEAMTTALRSNGNKNQLITVGQDEAGCGDSPSPQFHAPAVDFTCLHNWWANDDLVWDGVMMKAPAKPLLVEETGIMFYEKLDGRPWRSEEEAARLLERKMALSLGANGAGFVEWIWNINPYMTIDNEATIGFNRMAGTAKPELEMFTNVARFAAANRRYFKGKVEEDAVLVIPQTNIFTPRNHASEITRRAVRVMHYYCQTPLSAVGEYQLHELSATPKMLLVPSPMALHSKCWEALLVHANKGATVCITGPIDLDDHYLPTERLKLFSLNAARGPVIDSELVFVDGQELHFRFGGEKLQRIEKNTVSGADEAQVYVIPYGTGRIIWCPVPAEANDENEPVAALYRYALGLARIAPIFTTFRSKPKITEAGPFVNPAILIRPTIFSETALYTFASETDRATELVVRHNEAKTSFKVTMPGQRAALLFVERKTGRMLSSSLNLA